MVLCLENRNTKYLFTLKRLLRIIFSRIGLKIAQKFLLCSIYLDFFSIKNVSFNFARINFFVIIVFFVLLRSIFGIIKTPLFSQSILHLTHI